MNELQTSDTKSDKQLFLCYLVPTIIAVIVKAILMSIDTVFIGQGFGPLGLAAVGITMPFNAIFSSLSVFVGIGGAALMSIQFGKGNFTKGQSIFDQSLSFLTFFSLLIVFLIFIFHQEIVSLLGAEGELKELIAEYFVYMTTFYFLHTLVLLLTFFTMNDGNPKLPMISMIVGIVVCLIADYLLIFTFKIGIKGAAIAAALTQCAMLIVLFSHFVKKSGRLTITTPKFQFDLITEIFKTGTPSLLIELTAMVSITVFNIILLKYYTDSHLAAFSLVINLTIITVLLFGGISQASQPLFSYSYGTHQYKRIMDLLKLAIGLTVLLGGILLLFGYFNTGLIINFYIEDSKEFSDLASIAIGFFVLSVPFMGLNLVVSSFFQAVKSSSKSSLISILRGFVLFLLGMFLVISLDIENGIWKVTLFAEVVTFFFTLYFLLIYLKRLKLQENI